MTLAPYTHVTLTMGPDSEPHVGVSFHTPQLRASAGILTDIPRPYLELYSR